MRVALVASALLLALVSTAAAQKPLIRPEDAARWERLAGVRLSNDGLWSAVHVTTVEGNSRLQIRSVDGPQRAEVPVGAVTLAGPDSATIQFSDNSQWIGYMVAPNRADADRLRDERKLPRFRFVLRRLQDGTETLFEGVRNFAMAKGSRFVYIHFERPEARTEGGSDFGVLDLTTNEMHPQGNVVRWVPSKDHTLLALQTLSDTGTRAVLVFAPGTRTIRSVAWTKDEISSLQWAEDTDTLAFLRAARDERKDGPSTSIVLVERARTEPTTKTFDPLKVESFPKESRISDRAGITLSDDGQRVGFGIIPWREARKPVPPPQQTSVEIWNTKDLQLVPEQRIQGQRNPTLGSEPALWTVGENSFRVLASAAENKTLTSTASSGPTFRWTADLRRAILLNDKPYATPMQSGETKFDVVVIRTDSGQRTTPILNTIFAPSISPDGRYLAHYRAGNWSLYDLETGRSRNLTERLGVRFQDELFDGTLSQVPPESAPFWFRDDEAMLLYDRYDAWLVRLPDGTPTAMTRGRKDRQVYRYEDVVQHEDGASTADPMYFRVFDERVKASGYFLSDKKGGGEMVVLDHAAIRGLRRIKDGERFWFTLETFERSPNLFVTNAKFEQAKPMTATNPQQKDFAWSTSEIVNFRSRWGAELQGILMYPANYTKGRSYPMVTYIYEKLSDGLHTYQVPVEWQAYNVHMLLQQGYFVFMPDITYRRGNPGLSAVECLEPAIAAVLAKRVGVDSTRIGLMGHSWGGYQTAFVTTVSRVFAAGVAGAPLTELISMYNSIYDNVGITDQILMETSQGRMEVPFWVDLDRYLKNSPVHRSAQRRTPLLLAHGDDDGAVPFQQSYYLYNTLRRKGMNAVLLKYGGENHNFARRPNQLDYARRLRHFFDVFLKGMKPEPWLSQGLRWDQQPNRG